MDDRLAYVALNCIPEVGSVRVRALLDVFGSPVGIIQATRSQLQRVAGVGPVIAEAISDWQQAVDPEGELSLAERAGVRVLTLADRQYPDLLREIHDPPLCLYVRGDPDTISKASSAIAMVGSRHTTHYGVRAAESLAGAAAMAGWTVFSGLARGIDTVVHETVLGLKGKTVAVIGSGLGKIYPQDNVQLARRIAESAAVVSEFPMQFPPSKRTFPMRNRIISGLTLGTVVVQAGFRSGSLITAAAALDQNRTVFAVPGQIDAPQSRGCHALIKRGEAKLVESFQDVLEEFAFLPGFTSFQTSAGAGEGGEQQRSADLTLSQNEAKLLALIGNQDCSLDDLVAETGLTAAEVLADVFTLELKHQVRQLPGRRVTLA